MRNARDSMVKCTDRCCVAQSGAANFWRNVCKTLGEHQTSFRCVEANIAHASANDYEQVITVTAPGSMF